MFDFLITHNSTDNPTAIGILITVMFSFLLASLIALTYKWTTPNLHKSNDLLQTMVLIAIVAAMVMQAIGDSLARGLGMLGALAIIRFRTKLDNPRNMAFIFAAIANGIACGVYGFTIAFIGTIGFCITAILLKFSALGTKDILVGSLKFESATDHHSRQQIEEILKKSCKEYNLISERFLSFKKTKAVKDKEGKVVDRVKVDVTKEYHYRILLKNESQSKMLAESLDQSAYISDIKLRFGQPDLDI